MADKNDQVFDVARVVFNDVVMDTAGQSANNFRVEVQKWLKDYTNHFYFDMLQALNDRYAVEYQALEPMYASRKLARGLSERGSFLEFSGKLKEYLMKRNPERDFGKSLVRFSEMKNSLSPLVFIDRAGRAQFRAGSGRVGFAPKAIAFQNLEFSLEFIAFPEVRGATFGSSGRHGLFNVYPNRKLRTRFATFEFGRRKRGPQPARPLLIRHMKFYADTNLRNKFSSRFGVALR